jgi:hypothetical protein
MACETGQGQAPFAQHLADELGVTVVAPTELAWSDPAGNVWVSSSAGYNLMGNLIPTVPDDGQWKTFGKP